VNQIHESFKHGKDFKIGYYNVIEEGVEVGDNVQICNFVLLKKGTKIGNNCYIDSYVLSSGENEIRNNVSIRYQSIIARNVLIEDGVYMTAGVKTIYLDHRREMTKEKLVIGRGCFLGDNSVILGGVRIGENCIIGAHSLVTRDTLANGVYYGNPARRMRDVKPDEVIWKVQES